MNEDKALRIVRKKIRKILTKHRNFTKKQISLKVDQYEKLLKTDGDIIRHIVYDEDIARKMEVLNYTKYSNRIGLTSNKNFISQKNDVVLDFPFKDCYLQGGINI